MTTIATRVRARNARMTRKAKMMLGQVVTLHHGERVSLQGFVRGEKFCVVNGAGLARIVHVSAIREVFDA